MPMETAATFPPSGRRRVAMVASTPTAATDSSATTQRQPGGTEPSIPKASPGFMTRVREKKPSMTVTGPPRGYHGEGETGYVLAFVEDSPLGGHRLREPHRRHVEQRGQQGLALAREEGAPLLFGSAGDVDDGVDTLADQPLRARGLEGTRHLAAHFEEALPVGGQALVDPLAALLGQGHEVDALRLAPARDMAPDLVGGERQDGRENPRERRQHLEADRL